jgi:hypothetical protein
MSFRVGNVLIDTVLDRWANFDFKPVFHEMVAPVEIANWISNEDQRRLRAYSLLEAYVRNKSRIWLKSIFTSEKQGPDISNRREYGDANVLVETTLSSLLGDNWNIVTKGAIGEVKDIDKAGAEAQQQFVIEWADKEKFFLKVIESETQSIKFGDSVYVLGWDPKKGRVRCNVYDPCFYFPDFDAAEGGSEDFPEQVWIAWEYEEEVNGKTETFVKRMAWWLVHPEDETQEPTCWYQNAVWTLESAVDDFSGQPVEWIQKDMDLEIDFIPIVHVPNTVSLQDHFGESVLAPVLQIVDDMQATDTDLQAAAATTGSPPIAITGMGGDQSQTSYGPGTVLRTGDGNATLIDTSTSLDALLKLSDALLQRFAVNSRTPESLLGRVRPNEVPSGIALTLSFTPHKGLIEKMRLVRDYKYRLLFKFLLRLSKQNNAKGFPEGEKEFETMLKFGSFLPADKQEAMTTATQLYEAKVISLQTAVKIVQDAGYPVEDWIKEIELIDERDIEFAQAVLTITGNPEAAAKILGIDPADVAAFDAEEERDHEDEVRQEEAENRPAPASSA